MAYHLQKKKNEQVLQDGWLLWLGWLAALARLALAFCAVRRRRRVRSPFTRPRKGLMSKPLAVRHAMVREQ